MSNTIKELLSPSSADIEYDAMDDLVVSLIMSTDSYKFSHPFMFHELNKREGVPRVVGMSSYGESRMPNGVEITIFGGQMVINKMFSRPIEVKHVDAAEKFALAHFGRPLFARSDWDKVVNVYGGYIPAIIRAVPDGTVIRGGMPAYSCTVLDKDLFWMSSGIETILLRGYWYTSTIASLDRITKRELKRFYEIGGADLAGLNFALHDFGGRGVTCGEQAQVGGAAHLVSFMGSDTVEGILAANYYYDCDMSAYSVFATEHSVECSFGLDDKGEHEYIRAMLANAVEGSILSIVIDGKDMWRCAETLCTDFRDSIINSKAKVVFRPDSGDMLDIVPRLLKMQEIAFGVTVNAKGYKKINNVGIIYGDGVDRLNMLTMVGNVMAIGYAPDVIVFGSGGALLQRVNRDTHRWAQKGSLLIFEDGTTLGIAKDPVTDQGKKSKEGLMTTVRSKLTGELMSADLSKGPLSEDFEDMHVLMYHTGKLYNKTTLSEVRERASV